MFTGFPGIQQLNDTRNDCFKTSHNWDNLEGDLAPSTAKMIGNWLGQKCLTVISVPANMIGVGIGIAGLIGSACTLGAFKVAVYMFSFGNYKLTFPTGCSWFEEGALHSVVHLASTAGELGYDTYCLGLWVGEQLYFGAPLNVIFENIGMFFSFARNRIKNGLDKAMEGEGDYHYTGESPHAIRPLTDATKASRVDWNAQERSLENIVDHTLLSIPNIPINAAAALCSGAAAVILGTAFVGKAGLYAATNINIPLPTYACQVSETAYVAGMNVLADVGSDVADVFIVGYKISRAVGINYLAGKVMNAVKYVPEALFD